MNDAAIGETRVTHDGVCALRMEGRRERTDDSPPIVFGYEGQILEAIAMIADKTTGMEEGAIP